MTAIILTIEQKHAPPRRVSCVEHNGVVTLSDLVTGKPLLGVSEDLLRRAHEGLARATGST